MRARGWRGIRDNSSKKNKTTRIRRIDRRARVLDCFFGNRFRASTQDGLVETLQRSASSSGDLDRRLNKLPAYAGNFFLGLNRLENKSGGNATVFADEHIERPARRAGIHYFEADASRKNRGMDLALRK